MEKVSAEELTNKGICPTCYNKEHNFCVFGDDTPRTIFQNENYECILIENPRADGHAIISTKKHYKDMMDLPNDLCKEIYGFAQKAMIAIKKVYNAESVYLCTMSDGPMNHFHIQLIPRYDYEKRGSKNFVKERKEYTHDVRKINELKELLKEYY